MTIKSLKKFTVLFNRNEGGSLIPIVMIMVVMALMGGVFTSIMGVWKLSSSSTINSKKASYLAETAATYALQDANYRFFSKDDSGAPDFPALASGTQANPYFVVNNGTETAQYWIERPYRSVNDIDEYPPGTHRGQNDDDDITGDDDDGEDDDDDDGSKDSKDPDMKRRYTIIATGKVKRVGVTDPIAKSQVKVKASIIRSNASEVAPGVQTSGTIVGTGANSSNHFGMHRNGNATGFITGNDIDDPPGSETDIVIRPAQSMDEFYIKSMASSQGHYNAVDLTIGNANDDYPEPATPSFYYDSPADTIPNFTYVGQDLTVGSNRRMFGIVWVKRDVVLNGTATMEAIIICEGNIEFNGTSEIVGGIIHYGGTLTGNGNPNAITVNDSFFDAMSVSIPIVTVESWQETVSAN